MDFNERAHRQWQAILPGKDVDSLLTTGRILRIASFLLATSEEIVGAHNLTRGEFDLLSAVRRSGKNCRATELSVLTKSSGAAITKRLDRLSAAGLVSRQVLPRDRRVVMVDLTDAGRELVDKLLPLVTVAEGKLLADFDEQEIKQFGEFLARLQAAVDPVQY
ncbi:MarR family winged helix-turn-helix transcriptional regulator [Timonella senegalensis]|uniref:MarR family winged helix-turn-helix transcriptional regulator n=1 Tax=Timonella senegalensis TaxID=1465825 RepID=UPI000304CA0D|nr:MarR family transcriptional regulator [Timonella senegalensis]